jgi:hypothetical protein
MLINASRTVIESEARIEFSGIGVPNVVTCRQSARWRKGQSSSMRLTLRNQDEKGNAWSLANDQIWREPAARALRDVQTLRTNGTVDIATVAALLFVLAKKTCLLAVSSDFIGEIDSNNHFGFHAGLQHVHCIASSD